jgi:hypothetical protein
MLGLRLYSTAVSKLGKGAMSGKPVEANILDTWIPSSDWKRFLTIDHMKRLIANRYR